MIVDAVCRVILLLSFHVAHTEAGLAKSRNRQQILDLDEHTNQADFFALEDVAPMAAAPPQQGVPKDRSRWTLECSSVDSSSSCNNINKNSDRLFWRSASTGFPQNLTINLGQRVNVNGIRMTPSRDPNPNSQIRFEGNIARHEVYLSTDKITWTLVAYGTWWGDNTAKFSVFEPQAAQWVRLTARSTAKENERFVNVADFEVYIADNFVPDPAPKEKGRWGLTIDFPIVPAGAWVDPRTQEIVTFSSYGHDHFDEERGGREKDIQGRTLTSTWDPAKALVSQRIVTETGHDMFCPGLSFDANGLMLVSGGRSNTMMSIYDPINHSWTKGAGMRLPRGYQSSVTLPDGRMFLIGGSWESDNDRKCTRKDGEIYDPATRQWTMLSECKTEAMWTGEIWGGSCNSFRRDNHGWLFPWRQNTVFQAGPSKQMNWYTVSDNGGGTKAAGFRANDDHSMCGTAVMYDAAAGLILSAGGSKTYSDNLATKNAHVMKINETNATVVASAVEPMSYARKYHSSVILPDGSTFVVGGRRAGGLWDNNKDHCILAPELFSPETRKWSKMANYSTARVYHSFAILLPDASVLAGGGGLGPRHDDETKNHFDAQIYTPPYLITASMNPALGVVPAIRPVIKKISADVVALGDKITIDTDSEIANASLVRYGSATHGLNTDQRRITLSPMSTNVKNQYQVTVPPEKGVAIPGYWMLFVLNKEKVPSIAKTVRVKI